MLITQQLNAANKCPVLIKQHLQKKHKITYSIMSIKLIFNMTYKTRQQQEAQLSPRERAMRRAR